MAGLPNNISAQKRVAITASRHTFLILVPQPTTSSCGVAKLAVSCSFLSCLVLPTLSRHSSTHENDLDTNA
jgi:hypothetical protein